MFLNGVILILFIITFQILQISSRPYNTCCSIPCPCTEPCKPCAWGYGSSYDSCYPYSLLNKFSCLGPRSGPDSPLLPLNQPLQPPPEPPKTPDPKPPEKKPPDTPKDDEPDESRRYGGSDTRRNRLFQNLFSIPGAIADNMLSGEISI